jgi:hypothetical protein
MRSSGFGLFGGFEPFFDTFHDFDDGLGRSSWAPVPARAMQREHQAQDVFLCYLATCDTSTSPTT